MHSPGIALIAIWLFWIISWLVAARWSSAPLRTENRQEAWLYRLLFGVGALVLAIPARLDMNLHLWHVGYAGAWLMVLLAAIGIAFCWWARLHLGTLWSASVTIKPDHRIVDTGPYGLVRHPIYTGLLLAILATAVAKGTLIGVVGAGCVLIGIVLKAKLEESFLRQDLGPAAYDAYARRVPMLVPLWPIR